MIGPEELRKLSEIDLFTISTEEAEEISKALRLAASKIERLEKISVCPEWDSKEGECAG